ncbi:NLP4 protein [Dactylonectria macrodidyma]|uniref:NLP4 protein n=1 Tax=Dactylonectria macrodidyma TaxID=307937 RepID=A0A9P9IST7_9HYPO|nr:NLP4 protein [Dactylonectria macrodidyma]
MLLPHTIGKLATVVAVVIPSVAASPIARYRSIVKRDPPLKLHACATYTERKWQPAMDFDKDSCYNTPAVGIDGVLDPGMNNCYTTRPAGCRDESDLDNNNVYVRTRCNNGWCAHMYGYYFEKDVDLEHVCGAGAGHRNDWEHVVVWVQNDTAKYVAVSAHGKYHIRPIEDVLLDKGTHPKVVYHRSGALTHTIRFGKPDDDKIENHKGVWFYGDLVSYQGFPSKLRDKMLDHNWGSAHIDFRDSVIADRLKGAKAGKDIPLNTTLDDAHPSVLNCEST